MQERSTCFNYEAIQNGFIKYKKGILKVAVIVTAKATVSCVKIFRKYSLTVGLKIRFKSMFSCIQINTVLNYLGSVLSSLIFNWFLCKVSFQYINHLIHTSSRNQIADETN